MKSLDPIEKEAALHQLIDTMKDRLIYEARRFLKDRDEASAAVNFIFAKLWNKSHLFKEDRPATPYIISALRNLCRDILAKRKRTIKTVSMSEKFDAPVKMSQSGIDFQIDQYFKKRTAARIQTMLDGLYSGSKFGLYVDSMKELS